MGKLDDGDNCNIPEVKESLGGQPGRRVMVRQLLADSFQFCQYST